MGGLNYLLERKKRLLNLYLKISRPPNVAMKNVSGRSCISYKPHKVSACFNGITSSILDTIIIV